MKKIMFQMHIMWYETLMVVESLDSLMNTMKYTKSVPTINLCLNYQTYLETPLDGVPKDMFDKLKKHPIFKIANVFEKTDKDPLYNVADWRREMYSNDGYTMWGESDCIYPYDCFYILENLDIDYPHIITFANRKMWDDTWKDVEFVGLEKYSYDKLEECPSDLRYNGNALNQESLDIINMEQGDIIINTINPVKFDGAMTTLSPGLPTPFIAPNLHLTHDDLCAQLSFQLAGIPQYNVTNRMKGENKYHKYKRYNVKESMHLGHRKDEKMLKIKTDAKITINNFFKKNIFNI